MEGEPMTTPAATYTVAEEMIQQLKVIKTDLEAKFQALKARVQNLIADIKKNAPNYRASWSDGLESYAFMASHPTAMVSRGIEQLVIQRYDNPYLIARVSCFVLSRLAAITLFPSVILCELCFIRISKLVCCIDDPDKFNKRLDKVIKFALGVIFSPLGVYSPDSVSGFYLKNPPDKHAIRPFGVETIYGKKMAHPVFLPRTVEELQQIVRSAINQGQQISVIGAGMSQGTQTVPKDKHQVVINTKYLNSVCVGSDGNTVTAGCGATWEQIQEVLTTHTPEKSPKVKQASDPFSLGGSLGINCHGWAHSEGVIANTVTSMRIINAQGELQTIKPENNPELFGCMFGTLGYFGIIVDATLKIENNTNLVQKVHKVAVSQFSKFYRDQIKHNENIPLCGGRLSLDRVDGSLLTEVEVQYYEKTEDSNSTSRWTAEAKYGARIQRIGLKLIAGLKDFSCKRLLSWFWHSEVKAMNKQVTIPRNKALHPPINAFNMFHHSQLHTQWLQEYFIKEDKLEEFILFLKRKLMENKVRLTNATIRPVPKDTISVLPYAQEDRHAVVICFAQKKTQSEMKKTEKWIKEVNSFLAANEGVFYQAYMPFATKKQFETCYGKQNIARLQALKLKYDPDHVFGNSHTQEYYDS